MALRSVVIGILRVLCDVTSCVPSVIVRVACTYVMLLCVACPHVILRIACSSGVLWVVLSCHIDLWFLKL